MIYFIQRITGGPIKIGTSIVLSKRLHSLREQTQATLKVLGVMDGGKKEELDLHVRFHSARVAGEWFAPSDDLLAFIKNQSRDWNGVDEDSHNQDEYLTIASASRVTKTNPYWLLGAIAAMASQGKAEDPRQAGRHWIVRRVEALNAGRPEKTHGSFIPGRRKKA